MSALALPGPLSAQMLLHLALMNALAPAVAVAARAWLPRGLARLWPWATALQLLLLWGWHAPGALEAAMRSPPLHALMQASLLGAALLFWSSLAALPPEGRWRGVAALLVTGKLFCLLGLILALAPRVLYPGLAGLLPSGPAGPFAGALPGAPPSAFAPGAARALADQQLAGLVMVVVCPLSYVLAGTILTARWLLALDRADRRPLGLDPLPR